MADTSVAVSNLHEARFYNQGAFRESARNLYTASRDRQNNSRKTFTIDRNNHLKKRKNEDVG